MEPILPSITQSFPSGLDDPRVAQILLGIIAVFFYWSGVATIFGNRRDSQSLARLVVTRPLRTVFWWFVVAWSTIGAGALVIAIGTIALQLQVTAIEWWQALLAGVSALVVLVAIIDSAYSHLYP